MSNLTLTDLFCGAGGSSTGAIQIPGVEVRIAANHWQLAVDTHNTNHPTTDHDCADLSQVDPRRYPRTDILWVSPECTNHSRAKGQKKLRPANLFDDEPLPDEAAERSRATMWDVPRFAEAHGYRAIIVENVAEAVEWAPEWSPEKGTLFRSWLSTMDAMGYAHHIVYLNSMHAQLFGQGAPQSRDRLYVVFWRKGDRRPDIERVTRPPAACPDCGPVSALQAFKPGASKVAKYRTQYVYRCPNVTCRNQILEPAVRPAAEIIDWSDPGTRIGDRTKPLAAKTMARIQAGIDKYWNHDHIGLAVPVEGREGKQARPVDQPLRTMSTRNETGWAFVAELRGGGSKHRPVTRPLCTVTAGGGHHGLVTAYYGRGGTTTTSAPLSTCTTVERHGLVTPAGGTWRERATSTAEPIPARTTRETDGIAIGPAIDINDVRFRMLEPREIVAAMDFPREYIVLGNRREQVRMAGNAVTPPAARDLVGVVAESLGATA
ncbi:DNA cytosine methyltransferase [Nocardia cyriacigeorgica]|uniref:DNA (cytosine-5-)-methyltransferase n=1 Tax=Nocardia cyriacigeorgica TaxID=135487 RepID=A0A5R8NB58_9NOCA|nr:DNA cytosine methyltransferase [Nocardia cyriacigeorgica]TLF72894.1 DNA cytosine methyltransferase [Nocardia cyriacigeorgica]